MENILATAADNVSYGEHLEQQQLQLLLQEQQLLRLPRHQGQWLLTQDDN